jgi:2-iminoacetate synthase ThiH
MEHTMSDTPINYEAVLADIDARIDKLQATRQGIVELMSTTGTTPSGSGRAKDYLGMSIPEAAKKYLGSQRAKQSTQDVMKALEEGGLPPSKYSTVYAILRRREKQVGDIINMKGDWALAEWYPNHRKRTKQEEGEDSEQMEELKVEQKSA